MGVVPARVAGVDADRRRVSPADGTGDVHPVLLGAAGLLGVDALLVAGGVQAIGALAYGLPDEGLDARGPRRRARAAPGSRPPRSRSSARSAIDLPAGPSEGLVLADADADPVTVAADLITQAEHGADSPALLVTPDEALADAVEAEVRRRLATARAAATSSPGPSPTTAGSSSSRTSTPASPSSTTTPRSTCSIDVADPRGHRRPDPQRGLDLRRPLVARSPPATTPRARTTCCPTGGLARALRPARRRDVRQVQPGPADHARGPRRRSARRSATLAEAEGLLAHRDAVEARFDDDDADPDPAPRRPPDEPQPVRRHARRPTPPRTAGRRPTRASPSAFGIPVSQVLRFDLNTSPAPPGAARPGSSPPAGSRRRLSEYPPGDYRQLVEAAAARVRRRVRRDRPGRRRRRDPRHVHEGVPARGRGAP